MSFERFGIESLSRTAAQAASISCFPAVERAADVSVLATKKPDGQSQFRTENPVVNNFLIFLVRKRLKCIQ